MFDSVVPAPDWVNTFYVRVKNNSPSALRPLVEAYEPGPDRRLCLCATLQIRGGDTAEWASVDVEELGSAMRAADRRATWRRGVKLALMMLLDGCFRDFIVSWEPAEPGVSEVVCVYQEMPLPDPVELEPLDDAANDE